MRRARRAVLPLGAAIVCEVAATISLKAALTNPWWFVTVVLGYGASFVFLWFTLRRGMSLGVAYGIWGALGVAITAGLSAVLFGERITPPMGMGIALIMGGVLVLELGAERAAARARARVVP